MKTGKKDFSRGLNGLIQSTVEASTAADDLTEEVKIEETASEPIKKRKREEQEKQVTITIPPNLKRTIKKFCASNDITIKDLFINSVTRYMKVEGDD